MNKPLNVNEINELIKSYDEEGFQLAYDEILHKIFIEKENQNERHALRLPLHAYITSENGLILKERTSTHILYALIQSGSAAVGLSVNQKLVKHKALGAYMSRKKQGKSQIKYLKTRGKSKAGSRVRLANTLTFFEHINEKLGDYITEKEPHFIALSCSRILLPYLFESKVRCPFDRKDHRLYKIPKDIEPPNLKVLEHVHHFLHHGELIRL